MDASIAGLADEDGESPQRHNDRTGEDSQETADKGEKRQLEHPSNSSEAVEEPERKRVKAETDREGKIDDEMAKLDAPETSIAEAESGGGSSRKGKGRGRPRKAGDESAPTAENKASAKFFKVLQGLSLGLGLKIGQVYSEKELRTKCGSDKSKVQALEKFMKQPSKLAPAQATNSAKALPNLAEVKLPEKCCREVASTDDAYWKPYVLGQVVWHHRADGSTVLAKVVHTVNSREDPYRLEPLTLDSDSKVSEATHVSLTPFEIVDMKKLLSIGANAASVPSSRESQPFKVGQVVWWLGEKRPSWPAKIVELPEAGKDEYRIQLYDTSNVGSTKEVLATPISVAGPELLEMKSGDLPAFANVLQVVHDAFSTQGR